jgi:hypothetical protein
MVQRLHTYVEFIRPSKTIPAGEATTRRVDSRDLENLDIPPRTTVFYFYDSPIADKDRAAEDQRNCSKFYIVAQKLLSRDQTRKIIAPRLEKNDTARIIWDVRIRQNRLFALTRENTIEPVTERHIVVDSAKKQLWPQARRPRPKHGPAVNFAVAVQKDVPVRKPLKIKPRPRLP